MESSASNMSEDENLALAVNESLQLHGSIERSMTIMEDYHYARAVQQSIDDMGYQIKRELRLVLVGLTGVGKSSVGNTIIGTNSFIADCDANSVTFRCNHAQAKIQGRDVLVVDTPGIYDTAQKNNEVLQEMTRCVGISAPGPHAIILVLRAGGRYTEEAGKCSDIILDVFGNRSLRHMIVLFTHRDDLEFHSKSLPDFITTVPQQLKDLLQKCGNRYVAFNNRVTSSEEKHAQVKELLTVINRMVDANDGKCFTNDVYKDLERCIAERENKLREKLQKEKEEAIRELQERIDEITQKKIDEEKRRLEQEYHINLQNLRAEIREELQNSEEKTGVFSKMYQHVKSKAKGAWNAVLGLFWE